MCEVNKAKYRCPRCDFETCSAQCVKDHKTKFSCSGERQKVQTLKLNQLTESTMIDDFTFLKDIIRRSDNLPKLRDGNPRLQHHYTRWEFIQRKAKELNICLEFLPVSSTRRKSNTSIYNRAKDTIYWCVDWRFEEVNIATNDIQDTKLLGEIILSVVNENKEQIQNYLQLEPTIEYWKILMKVEHQPSNLPTYYCLDTQLTLRENLMKKTIIEYPTLIVVLPTDLDKYKIQEVNENPTEVISPINDLQKQDKNSYNNENTNEEHKQEEENVTNDEQIENDVHDENPTEEISPITNIQQQEENTNNENPTEEISPIPNSQ